MAKLKVLQLESWMKEDWMVEDSGNKPIKPIYGRDGYYLVTMSGSKGCWFEVDGKAYVADAEQFQYTLKIMNVKPWSDKVMNAYKLLLNEKVLDKKHREEYYDQRDWRDLRDIRRSVRRFMMKD